MQCAPQTRTCLSVGWQAWRWTGWAGPAIGDVDIGLEGLFRFPSSSVMSREDCWQTGWPDCPGRDAASQPFAWPVLWREALAGTWQESAVASGLGELAQPVPGCDWGVVIKRLSDLEGVLTRFCSKGHYP